MKTIKNNTLLYICLSIIAAIALAGSLVWGLVGLNETLSYSGGSQIKISCESSTDLETAKDKALDVLKTNKISVYQIEYQTNGAEDSVVIYTKQKTVKDSVSLAVRETVSSVPNTTVEGFDSFKSAYKTAAWVIAVTSICLAAAVAIALRFITKRWSTSAAYAVGFAATMLLTFAGLILSRVEIGSESITALPISLIIYSIFAALIAVRIRRAERSSALHNKPHAEVNRSVIYNSLLVDSIIIVPIVCAAIVAMAVGKSAGINFGVGLVWSIISAVVGAHLVFSCTQTAIDTSLTQRYETKKEAKEPVVESKPDTTKQKRPEATQPAQKVQSKKRPRRNKSNENKVVV